MSTIALVDVAAQPFFRGAGVEIEYGDGDIGWVFEKNLERAEP